MNEPGNDLPVSRPVENQDTIEGLRRELNLVFGTFLIASFTLTLYLGLEGRRAALELAAEQQIMRAIEQDDVALANTFGKLTEFGLTHPDFQKQVLSKFRLNTSTNSAPAAPTKK